MNRLLEKRTIEFTSPPYMNDSLAMAIEVTLNPLALVSGKVLTSNFSNPFPSIYVNHIQMLVNPEIMIEKYW